MLATEGKDGMETMVIIVTTVVSADQVVVAVVVIAEAAAEAVIAGPAAAVETEEVAEAVAADRYPKSPGLLKEEKERQYISQLENKTRCYNLKDRSIEKHRKAAFVRRLKEATL
jgi:hypothetical protein